MAELIWNGKYDKDGKKITPLRELLPFQTMETINKLTQNLEVWGAGKHIEWYNRLILGDKKYVLPSLLQEFTGQVDLIYIDPPFHTGKDFFFRTQIHDESFTKKSSAIKQKVYRDTWRVTSEERDCGIKSLDKYLKWFYETAVLLRELLTDNGSLYVHLDWHVGHYAKAVLDELFGEDGFRNDIAWCYKSPGRSTNAFKRKHDSVLFYARGKSNTFNGARVGLSESTMRVWGKHFDKKGQITYGYLKKNTPGWYASLMIRGDHEDDDVYLDINEGASAMDWWDDIPMLNKQRERLNYPTQKTEALLDRIVRSSSNEGDLVLDCFVGSGTTAAVAEKLGRRWIACDLSRFAIHTTRKRLLGIPNVKPFVVQNLGKYERKC